MRVNLKKRQKNRFKTLQIFLNKNKSNATLNKVNLFFLGVFHFLHCKYEL